MRTAVVVPSWNGRRWLPGLVASLEAQERAPDAILFVDNGSRDGSVAWLRERGLDVLELGRNTGFAHAVNRGIEHVDAAAVALVNTDVELAPDWLARAVARLEADDGLGAVATKMVLLGSADVLDDCGDVLRRDGVCEQRGHGRADDGRWDEPGEVFGASAGAAVYRRDAVLAVGGFDEPTVDALVEAVRSFDTLAIDLGECARNAERFDVAHFRHGMQRVVDDALSGERAPREPLRRRVPRGLAVAS